MTLGDGINDLTLIGLIAKLGRIGQGGCAPKIHRHIDDDEDH